MSPVACLTPVVFLIASSLAHGQFKAINPRVAKIVSEISEDQITTTQKKLETFGTRQLYSSQDDPNRGIGAARKWIYEQFRSYSPRLEVSYDQYKVKKDESRGSRLLTDVDLYNVVAVLPGTSSKEQRVIISAHYDTIAVEPTPAGAPLPEPGTPLKIRDPNSDAPGVTDDGSGVACVLELARVLSQYEFEKTLIFVTFAGEEQSLVGSTLYAARARKENQKIEAVLNNDIIGSVMSGSGRMENFRVNVFSEDPQDSSSRELARYVKDMGDRYLPSMKVDPIFRADRFGRGGDHTPFNLEGFTAVRISSPQEDFSHQHSETDLFVHTSSPYVTKVTRINAAAAASLAWAPKAPATSEEVERDGKPVTTLFLTRGRQGAFNGYDAVMRWKVDQTEPDLAGYVIVMRATTAPYWDREIFVGNVTRYTIPDVSIDEYVFGVKAVDKEGNESLVTPFVQAPRTKRVIPIY